MTLAIKLQQCLPFTVLKLCNSSEGHTTSFDVATVLTVYGIETYSTFVVGIATVERLQQCLPFTVLKLYAAVTD